MSWLFILQGDTRPPGRTFKASEPLDPNSAKPQPLSQIEQGEPVPVFEGFDTVDEIFQPIVEGGTEQAVDIDEEKDKEVNIKWIVSYCDSAVNDNPIRGLRYA